MNGGISRHFSLHWLDSFVQGSLASQPHPVIVHACAHMGSCVKLLKFVSECYALPSAFHVPCTVLQSLKVVTIVRFTATYSTTHASRHTMK